MRKHALVTLVIGAFGGMLLLPGCIEDPDCGVCDPDNLYLQNITGVNFSNERVHMLSPKCEGDACPEPFDSGRVFIEEIGLCEDSEEAAESSRPDEYCKIAPGIVWDGISFVFNNLLDPTSIELVRKLPDEPKFFEVYDWKTRVVRLDGPMTRYHASFVEGDGNEPGEVIKLNSKACIDNLRDQGVDFDGGVLGEDPDICEGVFEEDGRIVPLKTRLEGSFNSYRGTTDWRSGSCDSPDEGPDTCCTACDYELSVNVWKFGQDENGNQRLPHTAIYCDSSDLGNPYVECKDFIPYVDRTHEQKDFVYDWDGDGEPETHKIAFEDRFRETHPEDRPEGWEHANVECESNQDCVDAHLDGTECIGFNSEGACLPGLGCNDTRCRANWYVDCRSNADTTGKIGFCVDTRHREAGTAGCFTTTDDFERCDVLDKSKCDSVPAGSRLANCDSNDDRIITAEECCQSDLGGEAVCDPYFQPSVKPIARFDRNAELPVHNFCICADPSGQPEECESLIENGCTAPWGNLERHDGASNEGAYITRFVTGVGGVVYDPAIKGFEWRFDTTIDQGRALVESCGGSGTSYQDYYAGSVAMCSGYEYEVIFATEEDGGEYVRDKVGNTLAGRSTYTFETPQFHIVPGSGFPTDNIRIGACDQFELRFSNRFDVTPSNLEKLELWALEETSCDDLSDPECWELDHRVAGGPGCVDSREEYIEGGGDLVPCMRVDINDFWRGTIRVDVDTVEFSRVLFETGQEDIFGRASSGRYRLVVPGLGKYESLEELADDHDPDGENFREIYQTAFHDVCGMPLITAGHEGPPDYLYDFSIDPPKCREDQDNDGVQVSCDNAPDFYNPEQADADEDGFGDVSDTCAVTFDDFSTGDTDTDGIGNRCDSCRQKDDKLNEEASEKGVPAYMWVRNSPYQNDFDHDGIGDACDNCPTVANCEDYGPDNPHQVGDPVDDEDDNVCQQDYDLDLIGDECQEDGMGIQQDGAAGVVGFADEDDFDQDGIVNLDDVCPRQPVAAVVCQTDDDCGDGEECMAGSGNNEAVCNHRDSDGDGVGNICDTCPFAPNFDQITDGGMQEDDEDNDFVGEACETNNRCYARKDPRPYAFYEVAVDDFCCTTLYPGDGVYVENADGSWGCEGNCDPDGLPITTDCENEPMGEEERIPDGKLCRKLPKSVADMPGMIDLPPGCEQALADAGYTEDDNPRYTIVDFDGDGVALWDQLCFLPQWDQDFDGIGDACDLCEFAFDPNNEPYVAANGKVWTMNGKYCSGEYDIEVLCAEEDPDGGGDETGDETGDESGESTGDTGG